MASLSVFIQSKGSANSRRDTLPRGLASSQTPTSPTFFEAEAAILGSVHVVRPLTLLLRYTVSAARDWSTMLYKKLRIVSS